MKKSKLDPGDRTPPEMVAFLMGQLSTHPSAKREIREDPNAAHFYVPMNYDLEGWSQSIEKFMEEHCLNSPYYSAPYEVFWKIYGNNKFWELGMPHWKGIPTNFQEEA